MVTPKTELAIRCDGEVLAQQVLEPGEYTIGSAPECEVRLERAGVAPRHALLTVNYDELFVEPVEGAEVRVNDRPISGYTRLWPHQRVQCGSVTLEPHRQKSAPGTGDSLPPSALQLARLLPPELHRDRRYDIGGELGQGGMGVVLDARDPALRRGVAMKVLLDQHAGDHLLRFVEEAQVTGQLAHPNIPPVYELGVDENGKPYYTMKRVHGQTLREVLDGLARGGKSEAGSRKSEERATSDFPLPASDFSLPALLTVFQKICDAVAFAHEKQIIHRDLKPENIMLGRFGEVLVMDWGLAKVLDETVSADLARRSAVTSARVEEGEVGHTMAGAVVGTPQYMAPEQARGEIETMDQRADIYALGAILYHLLALRPPVRGKDAGEIIGKVGRGEIEPLGGREGSPSVPKLSGQGGRPSQGTLGEAALPHLPGGGIPGSLAAVVRKAMAFERGARYANVAELQADIAAYQNGFATRAEHAGLGKHLVLLIKRHRGAFGTSAAACAIITALAVWFVLNLTRERNRTAQERDRATANEHQAEQNARTAQTNEQRAVENETRAEANEQRAVAEKEAARREAANAQLAVAEAAYREHNGRAMQTALEAVPDDLRDVNWSYLLEASDTSIARIRTGSDYIGDVAAHPTLPGVFAVVDHKRMVTMLEARTGVRLFQFKIEREAPTGEYLYHLAFSPDGERIAVECGSQPGSGFEVHSAKDGAKLSAWSAPPTSRIAFTRDGRRLLTMSSGRKSLTLWDAAKGTQVWSIVSGGVVRGALTPDGRQVVAWSQGRGFQILNLEDGAEIRDLGDKSQDALSLAVHPDGKSVLFGDTRGFITSLDLRDGRMRFSTRAQAAQIANVAFTPGGERFISVAKLPDGSQAIQLWDANTGAPLQSLIGGMGAPSAIAVHPLSGELLTGGNNPRLWDLTTQRPIWEQRIESGSRPGAFAGSDDLLFSSTLIDLRKPGTPLWKPAQSSANIIAASKDGGLLVFGSGAKPGTPFRIVRRDGTTMKEGEPLSVSGVLKAFRLSPTADRLAVLTTGKGKEITVRDSATGSVLVTLDTKKLNVLKDVQWLNDTRLVGVANALRPRGDLRSEESLVVWDAATGQRVRTVVQSALLDFLAVAPDGKSFAAAGPDKLVRLFDAETLALRREFRAHDEGITALAWHPRRPILATGSEDLTIKLWNLETGRRLDTLRGPTGAPKTLDFSPSGRRLVCASLDKTTRVWEPPSLDDTRPDPANAGGWEDLLAPLKPEEVEANGNGWTLSGGVLVSPEKTRSVVALPGSFARSSYTLRTTVRRLKVGKSHFAVILPIGDQQVAFNLDGDVAGGFATGLSMVDNKTVLETASAAHGQQIHDSEPHDLEITVRLSARTAQVTATLDDRPLYEWSGAVTSLQISANWPAVPQPVLHLGASSADWVVSAVKVKRLAAGK